MEGGIDYRTAPAVDLRSSEAAELLVGAKRELLRVVLGRGALRRRKPREPLASHVGAQVWKARNVSQPGGEDRLPARCHAADDDHQGQAGAPGKAVPKRHHRPGLVAFVVAPWVAFRKLPRPQAGDLGPHPRPVRGVEVEQGVVAWIAARLPVRRDEPGGEGLLPEAGKVHDEKGEVRPHVDQPQRWVELDAVVDLHRAVNDHVLGPQVTVAVTHQARIRPAGDLLPPGGQEGGAEAFRSEEAVASQRRGPDLAERLQVLLERLQQAGELSGLAGSLLGGEVEAGDAIGDGIHFRLRQRSARRQAVEGAFLRDPAHPHRVLDGPGVVTRGETEAVPTADDRVDPEVVGGRETPVEAHLLPAHLAAPFDGAVVEEGERHRLLHLVGQIAGQEDPRRVRLAKLDALGAVGIEARLEHRRDDLARELRASIHASMISQAEAVGGSSVVFPR